MKGHSRFQVARKWLLFWCFFIGIGAVGGSIGMLVKPDGSAMGMQPILPYFQVLPFSKYLFQDFVFPGLSLLVVNGLSNLTAAALMLRGKKLGVWLGGWFGVTLMLWICIQFVIFPMNFMSTIYFIFGLCQAATGYAAWVFDRQESFAFNQADYPNVGKTPGQLVVYFSRMGYTRKLAYETADKLGAEVYEVTTDERTEGTLGFWWCGRFGMHRWAMPIKPVELNLADYDRVTICTPIWVFALCSPIRGFCQAAHGQIKQVDYVLVHYQRGLNYPNAVDEMDRLLGITHGSAESVCCHKGRYLKRMALTSPETVKA